MDAESHNDITKTRFETGRCRQASDKGQSAVFALENSLPLYNWETAEAQPLPENAVVSGLPVELLALINNRGLADVTDQKALSVFLDNPLSVQTPPYAMPGVKEASKTILATIEKQGQIVIFGDFDCDGITATAILTDTLRSIDADVFPFIPERAEGYGLSEGAVTRCLAEAAAAAPDATCRLLVTVDCGMGATESLQRFLDAGYRVVVSDHHTPGAPLPEACTVISTFDEKVPPTCRYLCGAGIAYKIAYGVIVGKYPAPDKTGRAELAAWLGPLAIATVADVVSLTGENRGFVREGLKFLNSRARVGIQSLGREAFKSTPVAYDTYHLGFIFAPHINASGRMESATPALNLLLAKTTDEAAPFAKQLKVLNATRKQAEEDLLKAIEAQLTDPDVFNQETDAAAVFAGADWHAGIVGLAAGKLTERLGRPVAVISFDKDGNARGSVRAPEGAYNVYNALAACNDERPILSRFGGHASAAGLSLLAEDIPAFRKAFARACYAQSGCVSLRGSLKTDGEIESGRGLFELCENLKRLAPCGNGNETPLWLFRNVSVTPHIIGKEERKHLALNIRFTDGSAVRGIWFGAAQYAEQLSKCDLWDIAGELSENEYRGDIEVQISVRDARPRE